MVSGRIRGYRAVYTQSDIYMSTHKENRFIREVEAATRDNPNIDMELINKWHEITRMLEKIPPPLEETNEKEPPRLQPIPLELFSRWS